jgi:hypothetical protein
MARLNSAFLGQADGEVGSGEQVTIEGQVQEDLTPTPIPGHTKGGLAAALFIALGLTRGGG